VAFLAIKEPPEGSRWVKLKAHRVLLIKTKGVCWVGGGGVGGGGIGAPSKAK